jgi:hypothetical protein
MPFDVTSTTVEEVTTLSAMTLCDIAHDIWIETEPRLGREWKGPRSFVTARPTTMADSSSKSLTNIKRLALS